MHKVWWHLILFRSQITEENESITGRFDYLTEKRLENGRLLLFCQETSPAWNASVLLCLNLETSTPDTYHPPPAPLPYDMVLGGPASTDSESGRETVSGSSFETLITCKDPEESDCKIKANSAPISPSKAGLSKSKEFHALVTEEEDGCPICLEEYDVENPKTLTKCEHHFHLSCILEWMERSDSCPICDQEMIFDQTLN
ncbi:putative E3 ubiquitin-protein ligase RHB1A [Glycine soja]